MTEVTLIYKGRIPYGFSITGHSTESARDTKGKTVCAAVSSAAYMAANTVLEVIGDKCSATAEDGKMSLTFENEPSERSAAVIKGFFLHVTELSKQYPERIRIITEV